MLFYFHRKKNLNPLEFVTKVPCFIKWLYLFLLQSVFSHPHFPQALRLTAWNSLCSGLHLRRWFLCTKLIVKSLGIFSGWWIGWWVFWNVSTDFFCSSLLLCVFFFMFVWIELYLPSVVSGSQMIWNLWILLNHSSLLLF